MEMLEEFQELVFNFLELTNRKMTSRINKSWNQRVSDNWIHKTRLSGPEIRQLFRDICHLNQRSQVEIFFDVIKQMPNLNMITLSAIPRNVFFEIMIKLPQVTIKIIDFNWKPRDYNFLFYLNGVNNNPRDPYCDNYSNLLDNYDRKIKVIKACMRSDVMLIHDENRNEWNELSQSMIKYMRARQNCGFQVIKSLNVTLTRSFEICDILNLEFQEYERSFHIASGCVFDSTLQLRDRDIKYDIYDLDRIEDLEYLKSLNLYIKIGSRPNMDPARLEQNIFLSKLSSKLINLTALYVITVFDHLKDVFNWISQIDKLEKVILVFSITDYDKHNLGDLLPMVNYLKDKNQQLVHFEFFFEIFNTENINLDNINNNHDEAMSEIIKIQFPKLKNFFFHQVMYHKELLYVRRFKQPMRRLFEMFPKFKFLDIGGDIEEHSWLQDFVQFAANHKNRKFQVNHPRVVLLGDNYQVGHLLFSPIAHLVQFLI